MHHDTPQTFPSLDFSNFVVKLTMEFIVSAPHLVPKYATSGSAGLDLFANLSEPLHLHVGETSLVSTGVSVHIKNPNFAGIVLPRSGTSIKRGLVLANSVGLIDSDYQGEILLAIWNRSETYQTISPGERLAQLILIPITHAKFTQVDQFTESTLRGVGGFGSTGT